MKEGLNSSAQNSLIRPPTQSIRQAGIKNILISVFVAGASFYSLILIAKNFGGSLGSDAYFFLASLSTLASGIIGSLIGTIFLPAFVKLLSKNDKSEANNFASSILSWCFLISSLVTLPLVFWNTQFFIMASRFDASQISEMHQILKYFAPIFLLSILSELYRVIALSIGRFSSAALTAFFPPFFLIILLIFFADTLQEEVLVVSLLMSKIAALVMMIVVVSRGGIRLRINLSKNQHTFYFVKSSLPYWSANVVTNTATFYFDYLASGLGAGVVTALAYANRIFILPISVLLNPLIEIARTKFAEFHSADDRNGLESFYNNFLQFVIYFSVPTASIYYIFSQEIISAVFQRGAFQVENVNTAASCLAIYALSIPFTAIFIINGRVCESFQRLLWPSFFGSIGNLIMIAATYLLVNEFGYPGIPIAKVSIEIFYLLPFGFAAVYLFGLSPQFSKIIRSVIFSIIAVIPSLIILNNGFFRSYDGSPFPILYLVTMLFLFILLYLLTLILLSAELRKEMYYLIRTKLI